jgi:hypothetical protein
MKNGILEKGHVLRDCFAFGSAIPEGDAIK